MASWLMHLYTGFAINICILDLKLKLHIHCQFGRMYSHLGDKLLAITVRKFLGWVNRSGKSHSKY